MKVEMDQQQIITCQQNRLTDAVRVAQFIIESLFDSFSYLLTVHSLVKYLPQFNANQLHELNQQCVTYFYSEGQSGNNKLQNKKIKQDTMPKTISKDTMVTFVINQPILRLTNSYSISECNNQLLILPIKIEETPCSLNYSLSKSKLEGDSSGINYDNDKKAESQYYKVGEFRESSQVVNNTAMKDFINLTPTNLRQPIPLSLPPQKQKPNPALQRQIQHLKKNLYTMRRYRRISIEQERESIDRLNKKKSHLMFASKDQHTYDYDGSIVKKKNDLNDKSILCNNSSRFDNVVELNANIEANHRDTRKRSTKLTLKNNNKGKLHQLSSLSFFGDVTINNCTNNIQDINLGNNLLAANYEKQQKLSFNNCNKRQVSHLPFISLKDSTKITQNTKQLSGSSTQRSSLYMKKVSDSQHRFRSFSQIELQRKRLLQKSKQKVLDFTEPSSSELLQFDIVPNTLTLLNSNNNNNPQHHQLYHKQSKMMQKYLKKLTQQKCKIQKQLQKDNKDIKFLNFNQIAVPQKYPIQRYYEYDFEGERKAHQYSISSKLSTKRNSLSLPNQTEPN